MQQLCDRQDKDAEQESDGRWRPERGAIEPEEDRMQRDSEQAHTGAEERVASRGTCALGDANEAQSE
jgi:hypothetical protein